MPHNHSMENNHNIRTSQPATVEIPSNKSQNKELIPPSQFSFTIGALSFFGFLITTCVKLVPLAEKERDALKEKEEAESKKNTAISNTNAEADKLAEARQRVIDLDCAISGYESFNGRVTSFRTAATNDPTESALDTLQNFWKMTFTADNNDQIRSQQRKSYTTSYYQTQSVYTCGGCATISSTSKTSSKECCSYKTEYIRVTQIHYYTETTHVDRYFKNIITSQGINIEPLQCGYYSRKFDTLPAQNYVVRSTQPVYSGNRESGATYIDYSEDWGSKAQVRVVLDASSTDEFLITDRESNQADAASDLLVKLFAFLNTTIQLFNSTGSNYTALQQQINSTIPGLVENVAALAVRVNLSEMEFQQKLSQYESRQQDYHEQEIIWLPVMFLVPIALAVIAAYFADYINEHDACADFDEQEQELVRVQVPEPVQVQVQVQVQDQYEDQDQEQEQEQEQDQDHEGRNPLSYWGRP